MAFYINKI